MSLPYITQLYSLINILEDEKYITKEQRNSLYLNFEKRLTEKQYKRFWALIFNKKDTEIKNFLIQFLDI